MKIILKILTVIIIILILLISFLCLSKIIVFKNPKFYTQESKATKKINKRYNNIKDIFSVYATIPGLKEGSIPQGLVYHRDTNSIIISAYHDGGASSVLHIMDYETATYQKSVILYKSPNEEYKGHAGGLAISDDYLWVSGDYEILEYNLGDIIAAKNMDTVIARKYYKVDNKADFLTFSNDMLWVGEYNYKNIYKTKEEHYLTKNDITYKSLLFGYSVNANNINLETVVALPNRVQGLYFEENTIILSRSFWVFQDSEIEVYENPISNISYETFIYNNQEIPLYYLSEDIRKSNTHIPAMSEGITIINDDLYILFESYANCYKYYNSNKINYIAILKRNI